MELPGGGDTLRSLASNPPSCIPRLPKSASKVVTPNSTSKQFNKNLVTGKSILKQFGSLSAKNTVSSKQKQKFNTSLCRRAISYESLTPEKGISIKSKEILRRKRPPVQKQQADLIATPEFDKQSATRIRQVLYLNTWRKGHNRLESIKSEQKYMQTRTDNLKEQNSAVLQILQAQRNRMTASVSEINEKSEVMKKYNRMLVAMMQEKTISSSKCFELQVQVERSEMTYEKEMAQKNILMDKINEMEKEDADIQTKINDIETSMAALRISDYMKQQDRVTQTKQITIKEKKMSQMEKEIEKASSSLIETKSNLMSLESKIMTMYFEKVNALKKNNETADKNCNILQLCKTFEDAFNTKEAELLAVSIEMEDKQVLVAMLSSQLHEVEMEEAAWRNKAYYFVSRLQPLILYILTQRVT